MENYPKLRHDKKKKASINKKDLIKVESETQTSGQK